MIISEKKHCNFLLAAGKEHVNAGFLAENPTNYILLLVLVCMSKLSGHFEH